MVSQEGIFKDASCGMKSYQLLAHTADIRLKVEAASRAGLFAHTLEGMANILKKDSCQLPKKTF